MELADNLEKNVRFLAQLEHAVRLTNNEIIHKRVPPINSERMISFAQVVARLRAQYIEAAFKFADVKQGDGVAGAAEIDELNLYRSQFETAREAFIALQRAIELGYMAVE